MSRKRLAVCLAMAHFSLSSLGQLSAAEDCNGNGVDDAIDVRPGGNGFFGQTSYSFALEAALPSSTVTADLDGDGNLDFVTAGSIKCDDWCHEGIAVLLGKPDGTFHAPKHWELSGGLCNPLVVDLDADGDYDLVGTICGTNAVTALLNSGGGSFLAAVSTVVEGGFGPVHHALPFDGDRFPDLVGVRNTSLFVLLGNGDGTFRPGPPDFAHGYAYDSEPLAADFDRDGALDIMVGRRSASNVSAVSYFHNRGDATFDDRALPYEWGGFSDAFLMSADLDGDRSLDLAVGVSPGILVFLNDGGGAFKKPTLYGLSNEGRPPLAVDLNGDAALDLAFASEGRIGALLNRGDGTFLEVASSATGSIVSLLAAADLEGDGRTDLLAYSTGELSLFSGDGDGTFQEGLTYTFGYCDQPTALVHDIDRDGKLDVVVFPASNSNHHNDIDPALVVLRNRGDGTLSAPTRDFLIEGGIGDVVAADMNGDGLPDLAALSDRLSLLLNQGDRTFELTETSFTEEQVPLALAPGDLDRDGDVDLALVSDSCDPVGCTGRRVMLRFNDGTGALTSEVLLEPASSWLQDVYVADLNSDGALDLVSAYLGAGFLHLNDGTGGFQEAVEAPGGDHLAFGDLDRDGHLDIAAGRDAHSASPATSILFNTGDGFFEGGEEAMSGGHPLAADLDGDGATDLAISSERMVEVLLNRGGRVFERVSSDLPPRWNDLPFLDRYGYKAAVDADQDGDVDLVGSRGTIDARYCFPGSTSVLLNGGDGKFSDALQMFLGETSFAAADLDNDGLPDFALAGASRITILWNAYTPPFSHDANHNEVPDECEDPPFHRGDPNASGATDISDALAVFGFLFLGGDGPGCKESTDANNDGAIDISDGIFLLAWLFLGGREPPEPGPPSAPCGLDPDSPGSAGDLGCEAYACG